MTDQEQVEEINRRIAEIKAHMPETYKAIQDRVNGVVVQESGGPVETVPAYGKAVFALVRRGLRGEPNCFWAMECGRVVGTPFNLPDVMTYTAKSMVEFGCTYACIFQSVSTQTGEHK